MPGDNLVQYPDVVMDRAFTLSATPEAVWPWFVQLGKHRSGWYLPRSVERFIPPKRRALRTINLQLQNHKVGDIIPDWGGRNASFKLAVLEPPKTLVYTSKRGKTSLSWSINLQAQGNDKTRVHLRLRLAPVKRKWLAISAGGFVDVVTIAGLAAGLQERLDA